MVEVVATTKPKVQPDVGTHDQTGRCLAPHPKNPSPMAATALCRQTPEVGAVCPNWACTDLCGGRSVMGVYRDCLQTSLNPFCSAMRKISRLTQAEFAKHRGISMQSLKQIEAGTAHGRLLSHEGVVYRSQNYVA